MSYLVAIALLIVCFLKAEKITNASVNFFKNYPILRYIPSRCFKIRPKIFKFFIVCVILICLLLLVNNLSGNALLLHG